MYEQRQGTTEQHSTSTKQKRAEKRRSSVQGASITENQLHKSLVLVLVLVQPARASKRRSVGRLGSQERVPRPLRIELEMA